jgi:ADP-ribose pyrophosphatase YjhB (NUDIX family)
MAWNRVRPIALALICRDDEILVARHERDDGRFYRPLGGGIEVGEYAQEAVAREVNEELGRSIHRIRRRAVLENVFRDRGEQAHEIVFVMDAAFVDETAYEQEHFVATEESERGSASLPVTWMSPRAGAPLYPTGLADVAARALSGSEQPSRSR